MTTLKDVLHDRNLYQKLGGSAYDDWHMVAPELKIPEGTWVVTLDDNFLKLRKAYHGMDGGRAATELSSGRLMPRYPKFTLEAIRNTMDEECKDKRVYQTQDGWTLKLWWSEDREVWDPEDSDGYSYGSYGSLKTFLKCVRPGTLSFA